MYTGRLDQRQRRDPTGMPTSPAVCVTARGHAQDASDTGTGMQGWKWVYLVSPMSSVLGSQTAELLKVGFEEPLRPNCPEHWQGPSFLLGVPENPQVGKHARLPEPPAPGRARGS